MDLQRIARRIRAAATASWRRLSATQRHMLQGFGVLLLVSALGTAVGTWAPSAAASSDEDGGYTGTAVRSQFRYLQQSLDTTAGELALARIELRRAEAILRFSSRYQIAADLAELIYDTALQVGLDPELAFRLVRLESGFDPRARSHAQALGLAQVRLSTARFYEPEITTSGLFDPATNLRIGFRYLRDLLAVYGDVRLALLAYNRGPTRIKQLIEEGRDPANGYASRIMEGYEGFRHQ